MVLDIRLAGFNVDKDALDEIKRLAEENHINAKILLELASIAVKADPELDLLLDSDKEYSRQTALQLCNSAGQISGIIANLTPEVVSASYARISRDSRAIPDLRSDARNDVESARRSNSAIIFTMGHKSIAEHAVFNFDIMGISRLAIEHLEQMRLCSYTEKSQRYITLEGDYVVPAEIKGTPLEDEFHRVIRLQNDFYKRNIGDITQWHAQQDNSERFRLMNITKEKKQQETVEGWGKEDARYSLSMATEGQLGMTISARNLETLITRFRSNSLSELNEIGEKLHSLVQDKAPSVIKYTEPSDYFAKTRSEISEFVSGLVKFKSTASKFADKDKRVIACSMHIMDMPILAGLVFSHSDLSYHESADLIYSLILENSDAIKEIVKKAFRYKQSHDPVLREFELGPETLQFVVSSSAYAQLKRHRMNTLIPQDYNINLGVTIPESIISAGKQEEFMMVINMTNSFVRKLSENPEVGQARYYPFTNSHKRRVLFCANLRQAYAFASERQNLFAQWDIRKTACEHARYIKDQYPITSVFLCGKHEHDIVKEEVMAR